MRILAEVKTIFVIFIVWKIVTLIITFIIAYHGGLSPLQIWGNWDGGYYLHIATKGYTHYEQLAFFPFYPILIKTFNIIPSPNLAAYIISNLALFGSLVMLYKIASFYLPKQARIKSIVLLLSFPTAFFFAAAYTESLLLFLTLTAFYFAKKEQWFYASIFAGLATFTKFIGIIVPVILLLDYFFRLKIFGYFQHIQNIRQFYHRIEPIIYLLLFGFFGLFLYSYYLYYLVNAPFYFATVQSHWGRTSFANPLQTLVNSLSEYVFIHPYSYSVYSFEVLGILLGLVLVPYVWKRFGNVFGIYTLIIISYTLFTGQTTSSLRFLSQAFPLFLLFATWAQKSPYFFYSYLLLGSISQIILLTFFLTNNWAG